jgi:sensor histidine kinase YesM
MIKMKNKNGLSVYIDSLWLAVGELAVALLVFLGFLIAKAAGAEVTLYKAVTGALLGGAVTVANFLILSVGINRAINRFVDERGTDEMDDETAEKYAKEHGVAVQNAMMKSYMFRMLLMIGALVLAGVSGWFNVIATVIPLPMYRPILYAVEFIKTKVSAKRGE